MTCRSCRWSRYHEGGIWCSLKSRLAWRTCASFEYEPGTDEVLS